MDNMFLIYCRYILLHFMVICGTIFWGDVPLWWVLLQFSSLMLIFWGSFGNLCDISHSGTWRSHGTYLKRCWLFSTGQQTVFSLFYIPDYYLTVIWHRRRGGEFRLGSQIRVHVINQRRRLKHCLLLTYWALFCWSNLCFRRHRLSAAPSRHQSSAASFSPSVSRPLSVAIFHYLVLCQITAHTNKRFLPVGTSLPRRVCVGGE